MIPPRIMKTCFMKINYNSYNPLVSSKVYPLSPNLITYIIIFI